MQKLLALVVSSFVVAGCATPPLPTGVTVAPDPVDFGQVFVGDTKTMNATLTNGTAAGINALGSTMGAGTVFGQAPPGLPAAIAAAGTLNFPLTFTPPSKGVHNGTWHLTLDRRPYQISLTGEGVLFLAECPQCGIGGDATAADGLDFGDVVVGQKKGMDIEIRNLGNAAVTFPNAPTLAPAAGPFTVTAPGANYTLNAPPNRSMVKIRVRFAPTAVGRFTATLDWRDATGGYRVRCVLQGNGIRGE